MKQKQYFLMHNMQLCNHATMQPFSQPSIWRCSTVPSCIIMKLFQSSSMLWYDAVPTFSHALILSCSNIRSCINVKLPTLCIICEIVSTFSRAIQRSCSKILPCINRRFYVHKLVVPWMITECYASVIGSISNLLPCMIATSSQIIFFSPWIVFPSILLLSLSLPLSLKLLPKSCIQWWHKVHWLHDHCKVSIYACTMATTRTGNKKSKEKRTSRNFLWALSSSWISMYCFTVLLSILCISWLNMKPLSNAHVVHE